MMAMNSMQRTLTTLGQQEPDRVPLFLLTSGHGAKEVGLSIEAYFSRAENVIDGQLRAALSVIPGWRPTITQSATVPVERITG